MFRLLFLGLVLLTRDIYSMSTTESGITNSAVLQTTTPAPTLEDLAKTLQDLLTEQKNVKSVLFGITTTTTKAPTNGQKVR